MSQGSAISGPDKLTGESGLFAMYKIDPLANGHDE